MLLGLHQCIYQLSQNNFIFISTSISLLKHLKACKFSRKLSRRRLVTWFETTRHRQKTDRSVAHIIERRLNFLLCYNLRLTFLIFYENISNGTDATENSSFAVAIGTERDVVRSRGRCRKTRRGRRRHRRARNGADPQNSVFSYKLWTLAPRIRLTREVKWCGCRKLNSS